MSAVVSEASPLVPQLWSNSAPRYLLASRQALVFTLIQSHLPERLAHPWASISRAGLQPQ